MVASLRGIPSKEFHKEDYLREIPCPSCGEIITARSHEEILKRIPAAVELAELISQCNNLTDYMEKLAFEDSDSYISPECLRYIFKVISQEELAQKIDSTISSW